MNINLDFKTISPLNWQYQYAHCIFLDFAKAFDTLNQKILLRKLDYYYGIRCKNLKWFNSYLTDRQTDSNTLK